MLLAELAADKPFVAARAAAIPEVAPHAVLVEPESASALAEGIHELYRSADLRISVARAGSRLVEQFEATRVAEMFLEAATGYRAPSSASTE